MKFVNFFIGLSMVLCLLQLRIYSMEQKAASSSETVIYVKNSSAYPVRISAGPDYPSSIALYPGQIIEFPFKHVPVITASTYGKVSHYLTGLVAELNVVSLLQDFPQYANKDCFVDITYEKNSGNHITSIWQIARYLLTQGRWSLTHHQVEEATDLNDYQGSGRYSETLLAAIVKASDATPEPITRDAALIWSMFPRAASKIECRQAVYPFNILGLDIGGLIASDQQLRNWGALLSSSLRKRFSAISNPAIWNAVNMIIADSVESLRRRNYYIDRDPQYPVSLLFIPTSDSPDISPEPAFPVGIIDQLKGKIGDDTAGQSLIGQLEQAMRVRGWTGLIKDLPPVPPSPSPSGQLPTSTYHERAVAQFLKELEQKRPEEQVLLDKVVKEIFEKIDGLGLEHNEAARLKYAALDKLRLVEQNKHAVTDLAKIKDFMSPVMIRLAHAEQNPPQAMQEWISLLTRVGRDKAYEYFHMEEQPLRQAFHDQIKQQDYQECLMAHLRQQIKRFESPE